MKRIYLIVLVIAAIGQRPVNGQFGWMSKMFESAKESVERFANVSKSTVESLQGVSQNMTDAFLEPLQKFNDMAKDALDKGFKQAREAGFGDFESFVKSNPLMNFADFAAKHGVGNFSDVAGDFVKRFRKQYSEAEKLMRQLVLLQSLKLIDSFNAKGNETWSMGLNSMSDWTDGEFLDTLARLPPRNDSDVIVFYGNQTHPSLEGAKKHQRTKRQSRDPNRSHDLPENFDWRKHGVVTKVENQARCSSCWAFAVGGTLESHMAIHKGRGEPISKQQLLECYGDEGCHGGAWPDEVFQFIAKQLDGKVASQKSYPYKYRRINPRHCHKTNDVAATVSSFVSLAEDVDDDTMREAIVNHGPLSAVMGVRAFRHYRSGVIYTDRCEAGYDHSISIVGFGTEGGQDYWIVKNSWGRDWGEDGYMRLARGKNLCGINDFASYPIV